MLLARIMDSWGKVLSIFHTYVSPRPLLEKKYPLRDSLVAGFLLFMGSIAVHLAPFIRYGHHPLGYDTGFYRRYLIEPLVSFPNSPVPGLGDDALVPRIVLDVLRLTHLPTDMVLYGSYIAFMALIPVALFFFIRHYAGTRIACISAIWYILSAVSYNTYWFFLWKNVWALLLLVIALFALERNWVVASYTLGILIQLSHKTTAVIYLLTLAALWVFEKEKRRTLFFQGALGAALFLFINMPSIREASVILPSAIFLSWSEFLTYAIPYIVLILAGIYALRMHFLPRSVLCFGLISFLYPLFHLPFYERIFVYLDVALAILAGFATAYLLAIVTKSEDMRVRMLIFVVLCVAGGTLLGNFWNQFNMLRPLVSDTTIEAIKQVDSEVPEYATLLTASEEAPWYEGWTHAHIAAPGLLHDFHNYEEWSAFWNSTSTTEKEAFLSSFPAPLYISTQGDFEDLIGTDVPCLTELQADLYLYDCAR